MSRLRWAAKATAGALLLVAVAVGAEPKNPIQMSPPADAAVQPLDHPNPLVDKGRRLVVMPGGEDEDVLIAPRDAGSGWIRVPAAPRSTHWIGVQCIDVPDALRAHVELPEGQGILILEIVPKSPAVKAGLQENDILLKANDKPLGSVLDLVKAVDENKEQEMTLSLIRRGKPQTLKVTPAKRPDQEPELAHNPRKLLQQMPVPGRDYTLRLIQPQTGVILPKGAPMHLPLPGNMTIAITKQGNEPATIKIKRDDQEWNVTEKDLDTLPKDIQEYVRRMLDGPALGHGMVVPDLNFVPGGIPMPPVPGQVSPPKIRVRKIPLEELDRAINERMKQQFEEMDKRMERIQKMMDQFQQQHALPQDEPGPEQK
ncbi:MAG: PDZ domain-containing protein [Pirellulales bacterium]|nr:PDZ domain-containing protein [Pirellulales bacterium]